MNRSFDIFRMSANGVDSDRGTAREDQMRARMNRSADVPFEHGIHHRDWAGPSQNLRDDREWGRHAQHLDRSADYGRGYGGFTGDRERFFASDRDRDRERFFANDRERFNPNDRDREQFFAGDRDRSRFQREPEHHDYWRHEAENERFRRGLDEMHGYPRDNQSFVGSWNEMRGYPPPSTYGNVPYDQLRNRPQHEVWRGRDENFDFWGRERHPQDEHPSLWQRFKGAFTGKGPKNYVRSDERIREDVCEHLSFHPYVDATDIEVIVRDGEVTLTGTVDARMVKRAAEECVDHVRGVRDIHNHLRVRTPQNP